MIKKIILLMVVLPVGVSIFQNCGQFSSNKGFSSTQGFVTDYSLNEIVPNTSIPVGVPMANNSCVNGSKWFTELDTNAYTVNENDPTCSTQQVKVVYAVDAEYECILGSGQPTGQTRRGKRLRTLGVCSVPVSNNPAPKDCVGAKHKEIILKDIDPQKRSDNCGDGGVREILAHRQQQYVCTDGELVPNGNIIVVKEEVIKQCVQVPRDCQGLAHNSRTTLSVEDFRETQKCANGSDKVVLRSQTAEFQCINGSIMRLTNSEKLGAVRQTITQCMPDQPKPTMCEGGILHGNTIEKDTDGVQSQEACLNGRGNYLFIDLYKQTYRCDNKKLVKVGLPRKISRKNLTECEDTPVDPDDIYGNWNVQSTNNLPNHRGNWSTSINAAKPNTRVSYQLADLKIDNMTQAGFSRAKMALGQTDSQGSLYWGGFTAGGFDQNGQMVPGCGMAQTCVFTWNIEVEGYAPKQLTVSVFPLAFEGMRANGATTGTASWSISTSNNASNNRGKWTNRIYNARANASVYFTHTRFLIDGNPQPLDSMRYLQATPVNSSGEYYWGGYMQSCPASSTCVYTWKVEVEGQGSKDMTVTVHPEMTASPVASPNTPSTPTSNQYKNWALSVVNNLPNGRGQWTSSITGAQPGATAYYKHIVYKLNGVSQPVTHSRTVLGVIAGDGKYVWGGTIACPEQSTCEYQWEIDIPGYGMKIQTARITP
ncbi:MAG: hypothetical protein K2Q26_08155 [Bdellovibrionales bacterium]|nr:hypothetical protein [Bdellovibrionales bacterium]